MKATANHPHYRPSKISCACGEVIDTFSTRGDFQIDICSACHPFYTGKQKLIDTAGRIERFNRKYGRPSAVEPTEATSEAAETTESSES